MNKVAIEMCGWYGAVALLLAFGLNSFEIIPSSGFLYQFLNLSGAGGIVAVSLLNRAYPPAALNAVWAGIALIALLGMLFA